MDHSRQSSVFNQEKLKQGNVAVIGGGPIANHVCTYLSGLGVGNITIIDDGDVNGDHNEFLCALSREKGPRKPAIKGMMSKMNDETNIEIQNDMLSGSDVIIDLTNDPASKNRYKKLADGLNLDYEANVRLVISASGDFDSSSIAVYRPAKKLKPVERALQQKKGFSKDSAVSAMLGKSAGGISADPFIMQHYSGRRQGNFSSGIAASLCVDEIRKVLSPVDIDYPMQKGISFDLSLESRFYAGRAAGRPPADNPADLSALKKKRVLVVGAGGTGTYTALNLALLGFGSIDIYDGDLVEDHNRNRQVLFYEKVGEPKAESLAERLSVINPEIKVSGHNLFINENMIKRLSSNQYDIIFSCVDRWVPRKLLNDLAVKNSIPLFDCAASLYEGRVNYFIPGMNNDLSHVFDFPELTKDENPRTNHCSPSVIVPNALVGAINAAEATALMLPSDYIFNPDKYVCFKDISHDPEKLALRQIKYLNENLRTKGMK